jgi:hypothetical protein
MNCKSLEASNLLRVEKIYLFIGYLPAREIMGVFL